MSRQFKFEDRYDARMIVPSDSTDLRGEEFRGLYVGGEGNLRIESLEGRSVEFKNVQAGTILPVAFNKVLSNSANGKDKSFNTTDADWYMGWATEDETPLGVPVWGLFNRFLNPGSAIYFEKVLFDEEPSADLADVPEMSSVGNILVSNAGDGFDGVYVLRGWQGARGFWQKGTGATAVGIIYDSDSWTISDVDDTYHSILSAAEYPPAGEWGEGGAVLSYPDPDEIALAHDDGVATVSGSALYGGSANGDYVAEGTPASSIVGLL